MGRRNSLLRRCKGGGGSAFPILCPIRTVEPCLVLRHIPGKELPVPDGHSGPGGNTPSSSLGFPATWECL